MTRMRKVLTHLGEKRRFFPIRSLKLNSRKWMATAVRKNPLARAGRGKRLEADVPNLPIELVNNTFGNHKPVTQLGATRIRILAGRILRHETIQTRGKNRGPYVGHCDMVSKHKTREEELSDPK